LPADNNRSRLEEVDEEVWSVLRKIRIDDLRDSGLLEKLNVLADESYQRRNHKKGSAAAIDALSPAELVALALTRQSGDNT
jgi:hypothetical protein